MIKTIIVDDEPAGITLLENLLKNFPQIQLIGSANSVRSALSLLQNEKPDLVLLDIQMPEQNGFELLKKIDIIDFEIVFTTAHDEYAIKAFKFGAIDYLLKPIDVDELREAVNRVEERLLKKEKGSSNIEGLLFNIVNLHNPFNKISIPSKDGLVFLELGDIIRCESDINYTKIFTLNSPPIVSSKPLKQFEELLTGMNFFRIHKSHLINLSHLKGYVRGDAGYVIMSDKSELPVSRRIREAFVKRLPFI